MVSSIECARAPCANKGWFKKCEMIDPVYDTAYLIKYQPFFPTKRARPIEPECQCHMKIGGIYYSTTTEVGYVNGETHQCGEQPYLCAYLHRPRPFSRGSGFPFFDLPRELRIIILDLLLVKGKVALTSLTGRFPHWKHEQPSWGLLQAVSRQMQAEASKIFYSAKNTFFVPPLRTRDHRGFPNKCHFPIHMKRVDCELNMTDCQMTHAEVYEVVKKRCPFNAQHVPFSDWSRNNIQEAIHEALSDIIYRLWAEVTYAFLRPPTLDLLRVDLTNCRCPVGCCRLGKVFAFHMLFLTSDAMQPKRFELCGLSDEDRYALRVQLKKQEVTWEHDVFLIDQAGCTCTVSSGARAKLPSVLLMRFQENEECSGDCKGVQLVLPKANPIDEAAERGTDTASVPQ